MKKPVLVIMAAGMGSRYGGLKQIDPIDSDGHIIIDFSIFDAKRAGFEEVIFIIKRETEKDFKDAIGNRMSKIMKFIMHIKKSMIFHWETSFHKDAKNLGEQLMQYIAVVILLKVLLQSLMLMIIMVLKLFN